MGCLISLEAIWLNNSSRCPEARLRFAVDFSTALWWGCLSGERSSRTQEAEFPFCLLRHLGESLSPKLAHGAGCCWAAGSVALPKCSASFNAILAIWKQIQQVGAHHILCCSWAKEISPHPPASTLGGRRPLILWTQHGFLPLLRGRGFHLVPSLHLQWVPWGDKICLSLPLA